MSQYRHLELLGHGSVSRVRLLHQRPVCAEKIAELTNEWNSVADGAGCQALVVDCSNVQLLGSEMLSKLFLLQRRLKRKNARLVLSGLRAEVREVLSWTRLDRFFEINKDDEQGAAALA
jgi:anti-anti-sigma factor